MKKFDLNIERVLEHWTVPHALREIIANALDESNLTNTKEPIIFKDEYHKWHIKDFGRGLKYEHLTQNENVEKTANPNKVIGKFGVGLKDAMATFDRRSIDILIQSKYSDITIQKLTKGDLEDVVTLHAIVNEPTYPDMIGTDFIFTGLKDDDIEKAKDFFLLYSGEKTIEKTNVKAYFSAKADDFSIEHFTNVLGIKPTRTYKKGEVIKRPSNPNVTSTGTHYRQYTSWELGTDYEESYDISKQLAFVLNQLEGKEEELNRLKKKYNLAYRFVIVIQIENNEKPAMYLDSRFIHFADSIGAEVDFDLYVYS